MSVSSKTLIYPALSKPPLTNVTPCGPRYSCRQTASSRYRPLAIYPRRPWSQHARPPRCSTANSELKMDPRRRSRVFRLLGLYYISQQDPYRNSIIFVLLQNTLIFSISSNIAAHCTKLHEMSSTADCQVTSSTPLIYLSTNEYRDERKRQTDDAGTDLF